MAVVIFTPDAAEQADELPRPIRRRMMGLAKRLESWPVVSGVKPLRGKLAGQFRMRTGDFRLQFRVAGETAIVERVGHRDGFYGE